MSATVNPDNILQTRGVQRGLDAWVVSAAFNREGACAFATGDGRILIARKGVAEWQEIAAHDGGVLSLAADLSGGWLSGGDDGRFLRIAADGGITETANCAPCPVASSAASKARKGGNTMSIGSLRMVTAKATLVVIGPALMSPITGKTARGGLWASISAAKPSSALPTHIPSHGTTPAKQIRISALAIVQPPGASTFTINASNPSAVTTRIAKNRMRIISSSCQPLARRAMAG